MIDWRSTDTKPAVPGFYLVSVETDDGDELQVLEFDGKNWIHEGEPTFCKGYMFQPYAWALRLEPADRSAFPSND